MYKVLLEEEDFPENLLPAVTGLKTSQGATMGAPLARRVSIRACAKPVQEKDEVFVEADGGDATVLRGAGWGLPTCLKRGRYFGI